MNITKEANDLRVRAVEMEAWVLEHAELLEKARVIFWCNAYRSYITITIRDRVGEYLSAIGDGVWNVRQEPGYVFFKIERETMEISLHLETKDYMTPERNKFSLEEVLQRYGKDTSTTE